MNHTKIKATRGVLLVQDIQKEGVFITPSQKGELRKAKVIDVGGFLYHICGKKIYAEPKIGDVVYFTYNGNETIPGTNMHLPIFDQLRCIVREEK
jgi:co-chaperonin GroES (HSP10)